MESNSKEIRLHITGMTCINCENRIENALTAHNAIIDAKVSYAKQSACIRYEASAINVKNIISIIKKEGYQANIEEQPSKKTAEHKKTLVTILVLFGGFFVLKATGLINIFNMFPQVQEGASYGMLFLIGLFSSMHCVAMCGGIQLSQCMTYQVENNEKKTWVSVSKPSFLYNLGRVVSYTIVGGIVGGVGSVISLTGTMQGMVQLVAGLFMIIMGLNMLGTFPWLRRLTPRMPKRFAKKIHSNKKKNGPFLVGLLNGFMPCGPLQAMQLYALSTGSVINGALSMFLFSIGTVPLMFGIGVFSSYMKKKNSEKIMRFGAVLVIVLGISMLNNGFGLAGFSLPTGSPNANGTQAVTKDGIQEVTTQLSFNGYEPIVVEVGKPVKWNMKVEQGALNGCNYTMVVREFGIEKQLQVGDNFIEFTPTETGTYTYSCWMGMIRSKIYVVEPGEEVVVEEEDNGEVELVNSDYKIPTDQIAVAKMEEGKQVVTITVREDGTFSPAVIIMQQGLDTEWKLQVETLSEENEALVFPLYNQTLRMMEGENSVRILPSLDFTFATYDYDYFGYVKVVEDIEKIDLEMIKEEINQYQISEQDYLLEGMSCH